MIGSAFRPPALSQHAINRTEGDARKAPSSGVITYRDEAEFVAFLRDNVLDRLFPSDVVLREDAMRVRREHRSTHALWFESKPCRGAGAASDENERG